jgi:argininosuccinate lyase
MGKQKASKPRAKRRPLKSDNLWGGRFRTLPAPEFSRLNNSFRFDYRLLPFDAEGSMAYAKALQRARVLTATESKNIRRALNDLRIEFADKPERILADVNRYEDVHSFVEAKLVERIGELGKKIHTGRSRNDQVTLDLRLFLRHQSAVLKGRLVDLMRGLVSNAERHIGIILPGYTHLQRAQPILLAHYWLAYFEMLKRDLDRITASDRRANVLPLGSGALAGSGFPINRALLARELKFSSVSKNSLDAVGDRDMAVEFLSNASILMMHLSRLAEDFILYSTSEFGFAELSDLVTSGSSIMPQKKNPDALELIRGKTARVYGNLQRLLVTLKALPMSYNKDLQEDKEALFDTVDTLDDSLAAIRLVVSTLKVNAHQMWRAAQLGYANATECADYLVRKGLPFRTAHEIVGKTVLLAIERNVPLEELSLEEFKSFSSRFGKDVYAALSLQQSIESKNLEGGTATIRVTEAIRDAKRFLTQL